MTTIHQLDADDKALLATYSAIDQGSGEAFTDPDCITLADDWREIAGRAIERATWSAADAVKFMVAGGANLEEDLADPLGAWLDLSSEIENRGQIVGFDVNDLEAALREHLA